MKNTTKGALAAGTAAVLLMGGAGSLASWSDSKTLAGGSVASGELSLSAPACADWVYATGKVNAGTAVSKFVPGDVVSKTCTFVVKAAGDNLKATLTTPATSTLVPNSTAPSLTASIVADYKIDNAAIPGVITSAHNNKTVTAVMTATFDFGTTESGNPKKNTNDTQNKTVAFNDIGVTLNQVNPN